MLPTCQFSFNIESNVLNDKYDHVDFFKQSGKLVSCFSTKLLTTYPKF